MTLQKKKVWIDLDNSPHIPFFKPIIAQLEQRGYKVILTARDCFLTCELADLAGLIMRCLQMAPFVWREKPDLAVSHG